MVTTAIMMLTVYSLMGKLNLFFMVTQVAWITQTWLNLEKVNDFSKIHLKTEYWMKLLYVLEIVLQFTIGYFFRWKISTQGSKTQLGKSDCLILQRTLQMSKNILT